MTKKIPLPRHLGPKNLYLVLPQGINNEYNDINLYVI